MIQDCKSMQNPVQENKLFDNQPELLKANVVAELLGISIKTIYDWHYKRKTRNIPDGLFIKLNRLLYIRTAELRHWITLQNQNL